MTSSQQQLQQLQQLQQQRVDDVKRVNDAAVSWLSCTRWLLTLWTTYAAESTLHRVARYVLDTALLAWISAYAV